MIKLSPIAPPGMLDGLLGDASGFNKPINFLRKVKLDKAKERAANM